jgi:hypothetical protein
MTEDSGERHLATALARIEKLMYAMAAGGTAILLIGRGWTWAGGWLLGSVASFFNYRFIKRIAFSAGAPGAKPRGAVVLGMRYVLLAIGAYVILKYTAISKPAALSGLFIVVAAVIVEILIELVYARD